METENPQGIAPPPSEQDKQHIDALVKAGLGEQAVGRFIGATARSISNSSAVAGNVVIDITDLPE